MDFLNSLFSLSATSVTLCGAFFITLTGYALGSIRFKGLQFGAAGVFLMALLFGYLFTVPALQGIPVLSKFYIANPQLLLFLFSDQYLQALKRIHLMVYEITSREIHIDKAPQYVNIL